MEERENEEIDLLKLAKVLFSKLWVLVLSALIFAAGAFALSKYVISPEYKATSKLYVHNKDASTVTTITSSDITLSKTLVNTYIVILQSDSVLMRVSDTISEYQGKEGFSFLGMKKYSTARLKEMISCGSLNNTEAFQITVTAGDPYEAKFINDAILYFLPDEIIRVVKAGSVEIIDKASVPTVPSAPSVMKNTVIGGLLGGVLAAAIVIVMTLLDTVIHSEDDLKALFPDIPVIGVIPAVAPRERQQGGQRQPEKSVRKEEPKRSPRKTIDDDFDDDDYEDED